MSDGVFLAQWWDCSFLLLRYLLLPFRACVAFLYLFFNVFLVSVDCRVLSLCDDVRPQCAVDSVNLTLLPRLPLRSTVCCCFFFFFDYFSSFSHTLSLSHPPFSLTHTLLSHSFVLPPSLFLFCSLSFFLSFSLLTYLSTLFSFFLFVSLSSSFFSLLHFLYRRSIKISSLLQGVFRGLSLTVLTLFFLLVFHYFFFPFPLVHVRLSVWHVCVVLSSSRPLLRRPRGSLIP